jgi:porin
LNPNNKPLISYVTGGLLSQGILPGRPLDVLALGVNRNGFSRSITPNQSYEGVIELNYKIQISDRLQIQPLMQWIINPSGVGSLPTIWATGAQINFSI